MVAPRRLVPRGFALGETFGLIVEPLGEFDDQAFGPADIAEQEGVLEVDDLPDRFPAGFSDTVDDATHIVDLEGDVPEAQDGSRPALAAGRRREATGSAPPRTCRCRRGCEPSRARPSRSRDR